MPMPQGYFTFVLHSHMPYVRAAGAWPFGEDILLEALAETYIPLLDALYDLQTEGVEPRLTIGLTPILVEQIGDATIQEHFATYVEEKIGAALADQERFQQAGQTDMAALATFYVQLFRHVAESFHTRYGRDLLGAFRRLLEAGNLDILSSAATHAYLPLMERDSTIYGQIKTGVQNHHRVFGQAPHGIWLPECAYRPAFYKEEGPAVYKPGLEEFLAEMNLLYFFVDTYTIQGGQMLGKAAGDVVGPYGVPKRRQVPHQVVLPEPAERSTFRPYYVGHSHVAAYGREERTGLQVWSAASGYPGDFLYREFHRRNPVSGLQYWRVTDPSGDLGSKQPYEPEAARRRVFAHAEHFVDLVARRLAEYHAQHDRPGIVVAAYDTELFGHWWFEGVLWLKEVMRRLANHPTVGLTNAYAYLDSLPPTETETVALPEGSWGEGGGHSTWLNEDTAWLWPLIHNAEVRLEALAERYAEPPPDLLPVLNQAAREAVLLEASDWPFLISTGQAREYATGRFQHHLARFNHLTLIAQRGFLLDTDLPFLRTLAELDNPFPLVDYRDFKNREGREC